ncbi:hypothetical protein AQJ66_32585 [Streptomyces bungoensis]|uniref:Uncharacterized protein n=1 Tax=Streptomyces bungoensis TaxID=285568 RepID=A0A101SPN8_9ACTN|nr:hypothetical protein AQJ66_32585 [Streptomyces bungoensis]
MLKPGRGRAGQSRPATVADPPASPGSGPAEAPRRHPQAHATPFHRGGDTMVANARVDPVGVAGEVQA